MHRQLFLPTSRRDPRTGNDLVIAIKGTSDSITLKGFAGGSNIRGNFMDKDVRIVDDGNGGVSILHPFTGQSVI